MRSYTFTSRKELRRTNGHASPESLADIEKLFLTDLGLADNIDPTRFHSEFTWICLVGYAAIAQEGGYIFEHFHWTIHAERELRRSYEEEGYLPAILEGFLVIVKKYLLTDYEFKAYG